MAGTRNAKLVGWGLIVITAGVAKDHVDVATLRKAVRAQIAKLLPQIIREEVEAALR